MSFVISINLFRLRKRQENPENSDETRLRALENEFKSAFGADLEAMTRRAANRGSGFKPAPRRHAVGKGATVSVAAR